MPLSARIVVAVSLVLGSLAGPARAARIVSLDASRTDRPLGGGSLYDNVRGRLLDPALFGSGGTAPTPNTIAPEISSISMATLLGTDLLFLSEVTAFTDAELDAIDAYVRAGKDVVANADTNIGRTSLGQLLARLDGGNIGGIAGGTGANNGIVTAQGLSTQGPFGTLANGATYASTEYSTLVPGAAST